jgi:hypothetical protein
MPSGEGHAKVVVRGAELGQHTGCRVRCRDPLAGQNLAIRLGCLSAPGHDTRRALRLELVAMQQLKERK